MVALRSRWVLGVSLLACAAALLVALLVGASSRADDAGGSVVSPPEVAAPSSEDEVPALRTESSRTYRLADGRYQAQVSAGPVNYRDAGGDWQPIDTDLASDGNGGLESTEAAAQVSLPEGLDDPAKVTAGSRWVSFALAGADDDVAPTADGSTATYENALDGVDAAYDAQPTGVKETLTLADDSAPASYRYALDASSGLTPSLLQNGTVAFRDGGGMTRFWLPAPTVQEAGADGSTTDHVSYRLSEDRQTLTVVVDPDWLAGAAFPVQVDPSVWYGDDTSCTLASATPTVAACGGTTLKLGHDAAGKYRTALRFPDLALAVPRTASVMRAAIGLYFESQTSATASTPVTVSGLSKLLGAGATWNRYDTTHSWTAAGGDIVADPQAATSTLAASYAAGWVNFNVSRLAERWLRSPSTNNGVLIRAQTETGTDNAISFDGHTWDHGGPTIRIDYEWHPGLESDQTFEQVAFDATSKIAVNAATGNVAVDSTDVSLPGVGGLDLKIRRTFNGQNLGSGSGMFGSAWSEGIDNAAYRNDRVWYDDSRTIYANGNAVYRFDRDPAHDTATTHAYLSPPNINADLVSNISTGVATLTFRDTGIKWTYAASYDGNNVTLAQISDAAGHHIDITPKSGQPQKIGSITDTNGAVLTFVYGTNNQLTKITQGATEWKYTTTIVNGHNLLTGYTNPSNQTTTYHYDPTTLPGTWDKLDRVTDRTGKIYSLTYGPQGDWSQLTQLTQDFPDARPDNITKFDYKAASTLGQTCSTPVVNSPYPDNVVFDRTVETDNAGHVSTYCYNTSAQVIQTWGPGETAADDDAAEWYAAEYGTTTTVAAQWLAVQGSAADLDEGISATSSASGFAGSWYDNDTRRIKVGLTAGTSATGVTSAAQARGIASSIDVFAATYTQQQLEQAQAGIEAPLADLEAAAKITVGRDIPSNSIEIDVATSATTADRARISQAAAAASVRVTIVNGTEASYGVVRDDCSFPFCDPPSGGVRIFGTDADNKSGACTAGFWAEGDSDGEPYLMTAGHCLNGWKDNVSQWSTTVPGNTDPELIGYNHNPYIWGSDGDIGLIGLNASSVIFGPRSFIWYKRGADTVQYQIRSVHYNHKGQVVCFSGATSAAHCGKITNLNQTETVGDGGLPFFGSTTVHHLGKMNICHPGQSLNATMGGDSGAPIVKGHAAYGSLTGHANGNKCTVAFQGAKTAEQLLSVHIVTSSGG